MQTDCGWLVFAANKLAWTWLWVTIHIVVSKRHTFVRLMRHFCDENEQFRLFWEQSISGTHTPMCSIVTQAVELWFFNSSWLQKHFQALFGSVFQVVTYRSLEKLVPGSGAFFLRFFYENVQFEQFSEHFRNVAPLRKLACNLAIIMVFFT